MRQQFEQDLTDLTPNCPQVGQAALHAKAIELWETLEASPHLTMLSLPAFTKQEIHDLVTSVLEEVDCSPRFMHMVWELTGGWPLYAEQVCWFMDVLVVEFD